jgi:hypothetical protein
MRHYRAVGGQVWLSIVLLSNLLGNHLHWLAEHPSFAFFHYEIEGQDFIAVTAIALRDAVEIVSASYHRSARATLRASSYDVMLVNAIVTNYLHGPSTSKIMYLTPLAIENIPFDRCVLLIPNLPLIYIEVKAQTPCHPSLLLASCSVPRLLESVCSGKWRTDLLTAALLAPLKGAPAVQSHPNIPKDENDDR